MFGGSRRFEDQMHRLLLGLMSYIRTVDWLIVKIEQSKLLTVLSPCQFGFVAAPSCFRQSSTYASSVGLNAEHTFSS